MRCYSDGCTCIPRTLWAEHCVAGNEIYFITSWIVWIFIWCCWACWTTILVSLHDVCCLVHTGTEIARCNAVTGPWYSSWCLKASFHLQLKYPCSSSLELRGFNYIGPIVSESRSWNGAIFLDVCDCILYTCVSASVYKYQSLEWSSTYVAKAAVVLLYISRCLLLWEWYFFVKVFWIYIILHTSMKKWNVKQH